MRIPSSTKSKVSPYITPEGHKRLSEEFNYLWKIKRPEVTRAVADAAAMGDRSENAEYIYGKKQLREIDSRMRVLQRRLNELKIVDRPPEDTTKIFFGAWIELEDDDGNEYRYRIVGRDELDPAKNYISIDSPMAKALLGKKEDDEVVVNRPNGKTAFIVLSIQYPF
ncbi:transcription elongation factor GreB [bacterium BMS3Abin07]|nr:transcription elongation factor GreB [bacterium BMS3Abin07]GBE33010.1 transcription elongation factor GreB [bacterium BMS3Bbin05]HDO21283.1 transcription elongation factor GreB [Nitrospirota bacterium]HDZ88351.1 transcription elongation factor GreB [Nitrospirota bacterium]